MARLVTMSGVQVSVADEKVDRLIASGGYHLPKREETAPEGYAAMSKADLVAEIDARNEGREGDAVLAKTGNKPDLVSVLEADDVTASSNE